MTDNFLNVPDKSVHDGSIAVERVSGVGVSRSSEVDEVILRSMVVFVCD